MEQAVPLGGRWTKQHFADSDDRLLARIAEGERDALTELYSRHGRTLFRYLVQICPDRQVAEEILQDTLVAVWQSAHRFDRKAAPRTWLFGIARRQAHNTLRRARLDTAPESDLKDVPSPDVEPEAHALAIAELEALTQAMDRISPIHREALALVFVYGLSYEDAATVLGVPVGTVRSRLSNARDALRRAYAPAQELHTNRSGTPTNGAAH